MIFENATLTTDPITEAPAGISCTGRGLPCAIPLNEGNAEYQIILDTVIKYGSDGWEGDVPEIIQTAADEKLFNTQATDYRTATARLAQYQLSVGRAEVVESLSTGEQVWNEETMEMDDVMADVITRPAIEPLEATVEVTVHGDDPEAEPTVETVANPLIVADDAERAEAQAVIDATPTPVKEHVDAEE